VSHQIHHMEYLNAITGFLSKVGVEWQFCQLQEETFLPGLQISNGTLLIDKEKLKYPGDILHEAGHIAVEPASTRNILSDNVMECGQSDGEEIAAIAWSWAASAEIGLPPNVVFHPAGYRGSSESLIDCFETGGLFGQPLLGAWGLCKLDGEPDGFPKMESWLRN
jgi:hypothetical protein